MKKRKNTHHVPSEEQEVHHFYFALESAELSGHAALLA
jgi:hypothetical protein